MVVWNEIFEADGAGGLVIVLWLVGWCGFVVWGGGGRVRDRHIRCVFLGYVRGKWQAVDIGSGHLLGFETENLEIDFTALNSLEELPPFPPLHTVHGPGCAADEEEDYGNDDQKESPESGEIAVDVEVEVGVEADVVAGV